MSEPKKYDAHLFICTNTKEGRECCAAKGASQLRDALKTISKDPKKGWQGRVRVNNSGCLGPCETGINAVIYPHGQWFTNLKAGDAQVLIDAVDAVLKK